MNLEKPYSAVIFTNTKTEIDEGYLSMARQMEELAKIQPGYLGFESAGDTIGISVSYWESLKAIADWKANTDHILALPKGLKN